jgi:signal transduction histidine kinase/CheY-like chemotaxis protein
MANEQIFLIISNSKISSLLEHTILAPNGYQVTQISQRETLELLLNAQKPDLIVLEDQIPDGDGLELVAALLDKYPFLPLILISDTYSEPLLLQGLRLGIRDYIFPPFNTDQILQAVEGALQRQARMTNHLQDAARENTDALQQRMKGLEALQQIGRRVTSLLDLDNVLSAVVDAAVDLTGAEEGSLLLVDEGSGELYMRAARNFREDFVRTFRLPIQDTLPGEVLRTGQPLLINTAAPKKIKTSYLVHTLMYVPLSFGDRMIGVLGVDNRRSGHTFSSYHLDLMHALADYAAVAVENARLYSVSEIERKKYEILLNSVQDGILILDQDMRVRLINPAASAAFELEGEKVNHKPFKEAIQHPDLIDLLSKKEINQPYRGEIALEDGQVLSAQVTPIPELGLAVIMRDITYLKELDSIKSDFVGTISHDLRSPLTAILGYLELLKRVGPLNDQQQEFTHRIQVSVQNITSLINDLLELGRIEAGFDTRKEAVPLSALLQFTVESMQSLAAQKEQTLESDIPDMLPHVLGSPLQLRQMFSNIIDNALQYSPRGGRVYIRALAEDEQIIIQITDPGIGIPLADQPYIFDKFYRGSNVPSDSPGTGLGLAIVKIIADNHRGRIWVESTIGQGSSFTVILPAMNQEL